MTASAASQEGTEQSRVHVVYHDGRAYESVVCQRCSQQPQGNRRIVRREFAQLRSLTLVLRATPLRWQRESRRPPSRLRVEEQHCVSAY